MKKLTALVLGAGAVAVAGYVFRSELEEKVLKIVADMEKFVETSHLISNDPTGYDE